MKKRRQPCNDPRGLGKAAEESEKRPCEEREWGGGGRAKEKRRGLWSASTMRRLEPKAAHV